MKTENPAYIRSWRWWLETGDSDRVPCIHEWNINTLNSNNNKFLYSLLNALMNSCGNCETCERTQRCKRKVFSGINDSCPSNDLRRIIINGHCVMQCDQKNSIKWRVYLVAIDLEEFCKVTPSIQLITTTISGNFWSTCHLTLHQCGYYKHLRLKSLYRT